MSSTTGGEVRRGTKNRVAVAGFSLGCSFRELCERLRNPRFPIATRPSAEANASNHPAAPPRPKQRRRQFPSLHCKRIRYTGLFAPQGRKERLEHCRRLIAQWRGVPEKEEPEVVDEEQAPLDQEQIRKELFIGEGNERRTFPATCRFCKGYMTPVDRIDGEKTMLMLAYLIAVMRWLAGKAAGPPEKQSWLLPDHFRQFVAAELIAEERRRLNAPDQEPSVASSATDAECRPPPESA